MRSHVPSEELQAKSSEVTNLEAQISRGKGILVDTNKEIKSLKEQVAKLGGGTGGVELIAARQRIAELESALRHKESAERNEQEQIRTLCRSVPEPSPALQRAVTPRKAHVRRVPRSAKIGSETKRIKAQLELERKERKQRERATTYVQLLGEQQQRTAPATLATSGGGSEQFHDCQESPHPALAASAAENDGEEQQQGCAQQ